MNPIKLLNDGQFCYSTT